jgi:Fanconi anaemia protein FancD2 nuclease
MISELRKSLQWPRDGDAELRRSVQLSVFFLIGRSLKFKKAMFSGWLRTIQAINDKHDHRPIDLIVLVVMIKTNDEKASVVEDVVSIMPY